MTSTISELKHLHALVDSSGGVEAELTKLDNFMAEIEAELEGHGLSFTLGDELGVLDIKIGVLIDTLQQLDLNVCYGKSCILLFLGSEIFSAFLNLTII